jgi:hypothetical protein
LNHSAELKVRQVLKQSNTKVTASFVKKKLGWTWTRAKTVLLELAANGSIDAERTSYGWIFWFKDEGQLAPIASTIAEVRHE